MRRFAILILSFIIALLACEFTIRHIIKYPVFGLDYKIHYRIGGEYWTNVWKPNSRYWNVEGGNRVFSRNNLGFPGSRIDTTKNQKIAILGSSYIEAYQIEPKRTASAIFSDLLNKNGYEYAVYNLGCSGHDPYDSYMRLAYYKKIITPKTVILVINSDNADWFARHPRPLDFNPDKDFGKVKQGKSTQVLNLVRNSSSMASLIIKAASSRKSKDSDEIAPQSLSGSSSKKKVSVVTEDLKQTLVNFKMNYQSFIVISVINDLPFNTLLKQHCLDNNISFYAKPLVTSKNTINGTGHLNEKGNLLLGELMYMSFINDLRSTTN